MELEHDIISIYLRIDQIYRELTAYRPLRRGGFAPALSDVEVLTMEIVGEMVGHHNDRAIWRYFDRHWRDWFPKLGAYKTFAKQCANLCWVKQHLLAQLFAPKSDVHIIDGVPMPVCHNARAYRSRMLGHLCAWSFCAAKNERYYGLRGHVVVTTGGTITDFIVTPGNIDDRPPCRDLIGKIKGMLIGDKGYIDAKLQQELVSHGIELQTPLRNNMVDDRPGHLVGMIMKLRKTVETTLSVLCEHFDLTKIKAHDIWHFTSKLYRKILAYNFYVTSKS